MSDFKSFNGINVKDETCRKNLEEHVKENEATLFTIDEQITDLYGKHTEVSNDVDSLHVENIALIGRVDALESECDGIRDWTTEQIQSAIIAAWEGSY